MPKVTVPTSAGKQVNDLIIKKGLSAEAAVRQVLGDLTTTLPPGSTITNQSLNSITYRDKEGYDHTIQRNGDANSPDFGRTSEQTARPAVLSATEQIPGLGATLEQAMAAVKGGLSGQLSQLTEQDRAALDAITKASQEQLQQQFTRQGGELVTQLFGQGTNKSTLAGNAAADLQQSQGLVQNQALSDAASRQLGLQQFLTQLSTGTGSDILGLITGQETQRALGAGQLGLGQQELDQRSAEAARNYLLEFEKFKAQQNKSPLGAILSGIGSFGSAILGVPGISSAIFGKPTSSTGG